MNPEQEYKDYDQEVEDIDEVVGTDVKINPDYYIHNALIKAQNALAKDDVKGGFTQYRIIVEHMEVLCRSAKMLSTDYENDLKTYKDTEDYKNSDENAKSVKLANKKLELMMQEVFSKKTISSPLIYRRGAP